ncbi:MAG TPA: hypothetical protein VIV60_36740 [Polyangiaceae bacterium]
MARQSNHSTELDQLFRVARRDIPSALEQRQLHTSVLAALRSGQGTQSELLDPAAVRPSRAGKLALKLLSSLGVVAAILVGAAQLRHRSLEPSTTAALSSVPSEVAPVPLGAGTHAPKSQVRTSTDPAENPSAPTGARASSDDRELPSSITTPTASATTSATTTTTNDAVASANAADLRRTSATAADLQQASTKGVTSMAPKATATKAPPSEAALIDQAHRELANSPSTALALTETHRKLYPKGILIQEREVIAIEALSRLGKTRTAEKRAGEFRTEQPHSIHEMRLRGVLGDAGVGK